MKHSLRLVMGLLVWMAVTGWAQATEQREKFNFNADWLLQVGDLSLIHI